MNKNEKRERFESAIFLLKVDGYHCKNRFSFIVSFFTFSLELLDVRQLKKKKKLQKDRT